MKITGRIEGLEDKFRTIPEVKGLLETLRRSEDWRQEFLSRALGVGRNTFKPYLDGSTEFWSDLRARYGGGKGYRGDIASMVKEWFEKTPELAEARRKVDTRLEDAWNELVLARLLDATKVRDP